MLQIENPANRLLQLHVQFVEECQQINNEMKALYAMPHKFVQENASAIDRFMSEVNIPGAPESFNRNFDGVKIFVFELEDFKQQTLQLFFEHRAHTDKCAEYLRKSQELRGQNNKDMCNCAEVSNELFEELNALRFNLKCIREKAGIMTNQLAKIEGKWNLLAEKNTQY